MRGSNVACANVLFPIRVPPRFCFVGCSAHVQKSALGGVDLDSMSERELERLYGGLVKLAALPEEELRALIGSKSSRRQDQAGRKTNQEPCCRPGRQGFATSDERREPRTERGLLDRGRRESSIRSILRERPGVSPFRPTACESSPRNCAGCLCDGEQSAERVNPDQRAGETAEASVRRARLALL